MSNKYNYDRQGHLKNLTTKLMVVVVLITLATMGGFFSISFYQRSQQMKADVKSRSENAAYHVSNSVKPTIWNIFRKSVEREYSTEVAGAVLDSEISDQYITAIMVYGNFGHLFMGKIKMPGNQIEVFDSSKHGHILEEADGKISFAIKQGVMTIGTVDAHYTMEPYKKNVSETIRLAIVEALVLSAIIIIFLFFALRGILLNPLISLGMAKQTLEALSEGVMVVGTSKLIEEVNPAFISLSEFSRGEILGKTPAIFFSSKKDQSRINKWCDNLQEDEVKTGEFKCLKKMGATIQPRFRYLL